MHEPFWPAILTAVTVIVCGPKPTSVPAVGLCVTLNGLQPPVTLAPPVTSGTAAWQLALADADVPAGHVTVGATQNITVLSVLVEASFGLPAASWATPAAALAMTVPLLVMPLTATL